MGWKGLTAFALCGAISRPPTEKFAVRYTLAHRVAPVGEEPPLGGVDAAGVVGEDGRKGVGHPLVGGAQSRRCGRLAEDDLGVAGGGITGRIRRCPASTIFAGWRQSVLPVHLLGLAPLLGSVGPVAGDVKLQDDGVVHDPVNRRGGGHGVGKDALPLREDQV